MPNPEILRSRIPEILRSVPAERRDDVFRDVGRIMDLCLESHSEASFMYQVLSMTFLARSTCYLSALERRGTTVIQKQQQQQQQQQSVHSHDSWALVRSAIMVIRRLLHYITTKSIPEVKRITSSYGSELASLAGNILPSTDSAPPVAILFPCTKHGLRSRCWHVPIAQISLQ